MAQKSLSLSLAALPNELIDHIAAYLPNRDIKNLRITSVTLRNSVHLRLNRVFLSANPLNIKVLREIADHDEFRKEVVEIIWDDTYLMNVKHITKPKDAALEGFNMPEEVREHVEETHHCPKWYYRKSISCIADLARSKGNDTNRPDHLARIRQLSEPMSPYESYAYYYELAEQQRRVISSTADVHAFMYALDRFPSLRIVTISTRAHGRLFMPMYETPMIRAFPFGFVYPPTLADVVEQNARLWRELPVEEWNRRKYSIWRRGFCSALRVLAQHGQHSVSDFIVEERGPSCGVSHDLLQETQQARDDLLSLLKRPGFRRLDLALDETSYQLQDHIQESFIDTLSQTTGLQHFSLSNSTTAWDWGKERTWDIVNSMASPNHLFEICDRLPIKQLRHLALQGFLIHKDDLVALLALLPRLRSVELRFLRFAIYKEQNGVTFRYKSRSYRDFLFDVRDTLGWRERPRAIRPKITIILSARRLVEGQVVQLDSEIDEFLYEDGENPFVPTQLQEEYGDWTIQEVTAHKLCSGKGTEVDEFEPAHERPNVNDEALSRLGITEASYRTWETGPWGDQTRPIAQEQGLDESAPVRS